MEGLNILKQDKPLIAILLGALSTIAYELFTRLTIFLGAGEYSLYQLDSLIITLDRPTPILGAVISFIVAGFGSAIFYYTLLKIGSDYLIIKSIAFNMLIWSVLEAFFMAVIESRIIEPRAIKDYYNHMFGIIIYGITLGVLYKKFLFKKV